MKKVSIKPVRCAIYTRVSTDHGLEQDFNSLDAQHDAAQAYIRSQTHAGWALIRTRYDDGGCDVRSLGGHLHCFSRGLAIPDLGRQTTLSGFCLPYQVGCPAEDVKLRFLPARIGLSS